MLAQPQAKSRNRNAAWLIVLLPIAVVAALFWRSRHSLTKPTISIFDAARNRDQEDLRLHVLTGTPVNSLYSGHTPLFIAAGNRDEPMVRYLLANGASPNAEGKGKNTALDVAALAGDAQIVQDLIGAGARLDTPSSDDETPLHAAAAGGNPAIVKLLISKGLKVNARRSSDHATPLCDAASGGHWECIVALHENGGGLDIPGFLGRTPLVLTILARHRDVAEDLVDLGADPNIADDDRMTPLMFAFLIGDFDLASFLLYKTKDLNWYDRGGKNALYYAVTNGASTDFIRRMIERGCNPAQKDRATSLLQIAIDAKNQPLVDLLRKQESVKG